MKLKINSKIKAATIVESIAAMVIIGIVFSVGMMVFSKMIEIYPAPQNIKAKLALNEIIQEIKTTHNLLDETHEYKGFTIEKVVSPYKDYSNLHLITLKVINNQDQIISVNNELIYSNE